jgi:hypothetical protein
VAIYAGFVLCALFMLNNILQLGRAVPIDGVLKNGAAFTQQSINSLLMNGFPLNTLVKL